MACRIIHSRFFRANYGVSGSLPCLLWTGLAHVLDQKSKIFSSFRDPGLEILNELQLYVSQSDFGIQTTPTTIDRGRRYWNDVALYPRFDPELVQTNESIPL